MPITPVCAHSLNARPFVKPDNGVVTGGANDKAGCNGGGDDAFGAPVMPSQHVVIRKSEKGNSPSVYRKWIL